MKPTHTLVGVAALSLCSPAVLAEDSFRPLDTRTRCIVLFRECLVLIDKKDIDGILPIIADGQGASNFKLYPDPNSLSPDLKRELQDVDKFFKQNFKNVATLKGTFNKILFSKLVTAKEPVSVRNTANDKEDEATVHSIKITIPDMDGRISSDDTGELRFVEIADRLYWVPFGW